MTTKAKLDYIQKHYEDVVDLTLMSALSSCAVEGNPLYNYVGLVFGHLWKGNQRPSDYAVDCVYNLFKSVVQNRKSRND